MPKTNTPDQPTEPAKSYAEMNINERLKAARLLKGWSQKQLAESIDIKQTNLSDIENNRRALSNKILEKVCKALEIHKDWMLTGKGRVSTLDLGTSLEADLKERLAYHKKVGYTIQDLDLKLSHSIELLKDIYSDSKLLREALPALGAPDWFLEKFTLLPEWSDYKRKIEEEFKIDHSHLSADDFKLMKVEELYEEDIEHWRSALSKLVRYIHQYARLFRDEHKPSLEQ